jgi:hypothetical protein
MKKKFCRVATIALAFMGVIFTISQDRFGSITFAAKADAQSDSYKTYHYPCPDGNQVVIIC